MMQWRRVLMCRSFKNTIAAACFTLIVAFPVWPENASNRIEWLMWMGVCSLSGRIIFDVYASLLDWFKVPHCSCVLCVRRDPEPPATSRRSDTYSKEHYKAT